MSEHRFHPVSNIFPLMSGDEFERLVEDIRTNGQREPIWMHPNGQIIDGRNRYRACVRIGTTPRTRTWDGTGSLVAFVLSLNLHRRHLDESQRAMVAAKAKPVFEEEARARQLATQNNNAGRAVQANLPEQSGAAGQARDKAAGLVNVSPRSVESASKVLRDGAPELVAAVEQGQAKVSAAVEVAGLPAEQQREIVAKGEKEILAAAKEIRARKLEDRREKRMEKLAEISRGNAPLDSSVGRFPVVYADPPWRYEHAESESRAIENQYPTMSLDEICSLDVASVSTDDCVLFLWATSPKLAESMRVLEAWGFTYRTCMVWDKEKIGMGYWARQQHELLLIATKGQPPTPSPNARPASIVRAPRSEHSAKPIAFYVVIECMFPILPKLELFCRDPRDGWSAWGNQTEAA